MKVCTTAPENSYSEDVYDALETIQDALTSAPEASETNAENMRAHQVPMSGVFKFRNDLYVRLNGKAIKSGADRMTLKRPCRAFRVSDGKVIGLNTAKVKYFPDATLQGVS